MPNQFLHEHINFKQLLEITAQAEKIEDASLVEKDYWIMHSLFGIRLAGLRFELKGGTSLSKGYGVIHRFSEDIDLHIEPDESLTHFKVYSGKNHDDEKHRESRRRYFDWLRDFLQSKVPGLADVQRDESFDDRHKYRNGGIRLYYETKFAIAPGLKEGILLEVGFDRTAPNQPKTITSWAYEKARQSGGIQVVDNRASGVPCYEPKYTFVEKLQAVVRKYRLFKEQNQKQSLPANFLRHYYDLFQLIDLPDVQAYIGTSDYESYKKERFRGDDTKVANSSAFRLTETGERALFEREYINTRALYFRGQPLFDDILKKINHHLDRL